MQKEAQQFSVDWLVPHEIILYQHRGNLKLADFSAAVDEIVTLTEGVKGDNPVHTVIDVSQREKYVEAAIFNPATLRSIINRVSATRHDPWIVVVDPNPKYAIAYIVTGLLRMKNFHLRVETSVESARKFLEDKTATIET